MFFNTSFPIIENYIWKWCVQTQIIKTSYKRPFSDLRGSLFLGNGAPSPYVDTLDEEAFEDLLAANRIPRKGQEMFWTGRTQHSYLDECSNDSVMSTSSRLDESQAKLGEIADRLDSFFCEDDPILLPSSALSTSDKSSSENPIPGKKFRKAFFFYLQNR